MATFTVSFSLDADDDRAIINWLKAIPKGEKSAEIRRVLKAGLGQSAGVTLGDVYQAVKDLERKVGRGGFVLVQAGQLDDQVGRRFDDEPADAANNLDKLGL